MAGRPASVLKAVWPGDWSQDRCWDRSQDQFQDRSWDRSQDQTPVLDWSWTSPDWSQDIHFSCVRACFPGTIIDSNHFQLHPTPVPAAGGWDGRQRVGNPCAPKEHHHLFIFLCVGGGGGGLRYNPMFGRYPLIFETNVG